LSDPLVTVLVNNFNYARFLSAAIDSALAQSYEPVELVVVDDGSTDESRDVLSSYGDSIVSVLKENGGQASTFNAGFARSGGGIVMFLDSDDLLHPDAASRVVDAFSEHPEAGLVQARLELADAGGAPLGRFVPPAYIRMPTGDLRHRLRDLNNGSWWAPTSGVAVTATVLAEVLPLPEEPFRIAADIGLTRAAALCAPVVSLATPGGYYRSHGSNYANRGELDLTKLRADVDRFFEQQRHLRSFADGVGVRGYPADPRSLVDPVFAVQRTVLVALGGSTDRLSGDSRALVCWHGLRTALLRSDVDAGMRALMACWFALMVVLPRRVARSLATTALLRRKRPSMLPAAWRRR
jgi:glycosyltransferase involved in cell wall biosynthesis